MASKKSKSDQSLESWVNAINNMELKRPPKLTQAESLLDSVDKSVVDKFIEEHDISKEKFYSALQTMKDFELFVDKIEELN